MTTALQSTSSISSREIAPRNQWVWLSEKPGHFASLEKDFNEWVAGVQGNEVLFRKHVYENDHPSQFDFRQHRAGLSVAIARGESLALLFLSSEGGGTQRYVDLIDEKVAALRVVLHEWHGEISGDANLPESLRDGLKEAEEGHGLEDLETLILGD